MLVFPVCHVLNYEYAENNNKKTTQVGFWCPVSLSHFMVFYPDSLPLFVLLFRGTVMDGSHCCKIPPQNMVIWHSDEEWGVLSGYKSCSWELTACLEVLHCVMFTEVFSFSAALKKCGHSHLVSIFSIRTLKVKIRNRRSALMTIFTLNLTCFNCISAHHVICVLITSVTAAHLSQNWTTFILYVDYSGQKYVDTWTYVIFEPGGTDVRWYNVWLQFISKVFDRVEVRLCADKSSSHQRKVSVRSTLWQNHVFVIYVDLGNCGQSWEQVWFP